MSDFGGKLRQARERRGLSLRQIAANTRITPAALEALERNDISRLPGGIFTRAFVRSYAIEVGLDPEETVREFLDLFQPPPSGAPDPDSAFESQQRTAGVVLKLVVASVVLGGVILYFTFRRETPAALAPMSDASPFPPPRPDDPQPAAQLLPASPGQAKAEGFTIDLHPTAACWIQLTVDGGQVVSRVMKAGERVSYKVTRAASLQVGDAAAFAFSLNGRTGRLRGTTGQVRAASITASNLAEYIR